MFGVLTSKTYADDIKVAIDHQKPFFYQEGDFTEEEFIQHCKSSTLIEIKNLIIDIDCCQEEMAIIKGIRQIKIARPQTRVILIAVDREPGNSALSEAVGLGVYDIIAPAIPDIPEGEENIEFDISEDIKERIKVPGFYPDVARYHTINEIRKEVVLKDKNMFSNLLKEKVNSKKDSHTKKNLEIHKEIIVEPKYIKIPNNTVAVLNLTYRSGATFTTINLAKAFANNNFSVSVLEMPKHYFGKTYIYDILGFGLEEEEDHSFYSVPHLIQKEKKVDRSAIYNRDKIDWLVINPHLETIKEWSYNDFILYIHQSKSNITLLDIGNAYYEEEDFKKIDKLLYDIDHVFIVIDPLPQFLLSSNELLDYFESLRKDGASIHYIFNKWNPGIDTKLIKKELGIPFDYKIPYIQPHLVYEAIYQCNIPLINKEIIEVLSKPLEKIMNKIIPVDQWPINKKQNKSLLKRMFSKGEF